MQAKRILQQIQWFHTGALPVQCSRDLQSHTQQSADEEQFILVLQPSRSYSGHERQFRKMTDYAWEMLFRKMNGNSFSTLAAVQQQHLLTGITGKHNIIHCFCFLFSKTLAAEIHAIFIYGSKLFCKMTFLHISNTYYIFDTFYSKLLK